MSSIIFGCIRDKRKREIKKLCNYKESLFSIDTSMFDKAFEYDANYHLEDDEFFKVPDFSMKKYFPDSIRGDVDTTAYLDFIKIEPEKIIYIYSVQDKEYYCFQNIGMVNIIHKKILQLGNKTVVDKAKNRLIVNENPDAIYSKSHDTLYFRDIIKVRKLFPGIEEIYRDATDQEVKDFLKVKYIKLGLGFDFSKVGKHNRKMIAIAADTIKKWEDGEIDLCDYIHNYSPQLKYDSHSFEITTDSELTAFIYGVEQRYYTTPATNEKRLANSIRKL